MTVLEALLVACAGFLGGAVNALAGGGSLISFPALVAVGYPAVTANVTNSLAMWPGYASSSVAFRSELSARRDELRALGITATLGGVAGSVLLLGLPSEVFDALVPWCVLLASLLLAVQPRLADLIRKRDRHPDRASHRSPALHGALFVAGAYGAYFGGGLGVVLLGVLGLYLTEHLHVLMGMKNLLSLLVNTVAMVAFALFAPVSWVAFAVVAPAAFAGGFTGSRVAKRIPPRPLRIGIVVVGTAVGVTMLLRG